jgi:hypothetical protein
MVHDTLVGHQELERKDQVEVSGEDQYLPGRLEVRDFWPVRRPSWETKKMGKNDLSIPSIIMHEIGPENKHETHFSAVNLLTGSINICKRC